MSTTDAIADADLPEKLEVSFPIEEALNGKTPEESNLDEESIETFVEWTADIETSRALRALAREIVDEDALPQATSLLWIDRAEVYSLCGSCYHDQRDGAWTGSTSNPHYDELRKQKQQALEDGRPCTDCKHERLDELVDELEQRVDVDVTVEGYSDSEVNLNADD